MSLNACRDDAARFLEGIHASNESLEAKLRMLQEELDVLKTADPSDEETVSHQAYDILFLIMEVAAQYHIDLDAAWAVGQKRKAKKYL